MLASTEAGIEDGVDPDAEQTLVLGFRQQSRVRIRVRHWRIRIGAGRSPVSASNMFCIEADSNQALNLGHEIELEAGATLRWVRMGDMGDTNQLLGFAHRDWERAPSGCICELPGRSVVAAGNRQVDLGGAHAM